MKFAVASAIVSCFVFSPASIMCATESAHSSPTDQPAVTGLLFKEIRVDGELHKYAIYLPRDYSADAEKKWPLILFLHGRGESGIDGARQTSQGLGPAILRNADRWPFIVVFPQKPERDRQWEDYESMVLAILNETERAFRIDESRRYLTGLSQGGHGTMVFGARHAEKWAAIAPICGYPGGEPLAKRLREIPAWCFHGEEDSVVPLSETVSFVEAVRAEGGTVKLTTYPETGHNSWDAAYADPELPRWFLSNQK